MVGFLFGGNTGETADSIARKRKMLDAMTSQILGNQPKNANDGIGMLLASLGGAIGDYRLGQQEKAGTEAATNRFNEIAKGFFGRNDGNTITPPVVSNELSKSAPTANAGMEGGNVYNDFIGEVKKSGLTNPYGLAAVAATGRAESGYDPQKVNASWPDPSQSGQPGMSGGIMSWRGPRLQAMREFAQANGEDPSNISPAMQARFLAQEDPALFQSLNNAKSVEEAQSLINNAWKFAGYDGPSKESARRLGYAQEYLPSFQTTETASLDPSVGMPAAGDANAQRDTGWLRYANSGATRSQPISDDLQGALSFLPEMGVQMEVFSGGQPGKGESGARTGSTRHDHGGAADVFFYKDGRKLDWNNPDDVPIFQEIVRRGKANGITGFGAGDNYMQPGSMHIGFGAPAVWGAGGKGANAADWLRTAYASADQPTGGQQAIASIMADQPTELAPIQATAEMQPDDAWAGLRSPFVPRDMRNAMVADASGFVPGGTAQGEGMERRRRGNENSPFIPRDMRAEQPQHVQQPATTGQTGQYGIEELYGLVGNKFLPEELRAQARAMIDMQMDEIRAQRELQRKQADPMYQMQREKAQIDLEDARKGNWSKLDGITLFNQRTGETRKIEGGVDDPTEYGLNPQYGVDANGNPVLLQLGKNGQGVQTKLPEGVTLSKEPIKLDAGTHYVLLDPITRQPVGQVAKENREAARDTAIGKAEGEAQGAAAAGLGSSRQIAKEITDQIDSVLSDPNLDSSVGSWQGRLPSIRQGAVDFDKKVERLRSQAFLQAREFLKGQGPITDYESRKAETAAAQLDQAQSEEQFRAALQDFKDAVASGLQKVEMMSGQRQLPQPVTTTTTDAQPTTGGKRLKFNPATGELE